MIEGAASARKATASPVSIIVPVWNTADYLDQCLTSLRAQTMTEIEIIIVDDASTDQSGEIIQAHARDDPRINTLSHAENRGLMITRQTGFAVARGAYIMTVDSDDYLNPDTVKTLYQAIEREAACIVQCGGKTVEQGRASSFPYFRPVHARLEGTRIFERFLRKEIAYSLCNKIYRRDLWEMARRHLPSFNLKTEDVLFGAYLNYYAQRFIGLGDELYYYRLRPDSGFSSTAPGELCFRAWSAAYITHEIAELVAAITDEPAVEGAFAFHRRVYLAPHLTNFLACATLSTEEARDTLEKCLRYISWSEFQIYGIDSLCELRGGGRRFRALIRAWLAQKLSGTDSHLKGNYF